VARNCNALQVGADDRANALIREANRADIDYDGRTRHGATQGVKFP